MSAEFGAQGPVGCSVDVCNWMNVYNQLLDGFKQEVVVGGGELDEETIKVVRQKASREFMSGWYVPDVKSIVREWSRAEVVDSDVVYVRSEFGYQIQRKDTQEVIGSTEEMFIKKRQELGKEDTEESLTLKKAFEAVETNGEVYFPVHNQTDGKDAVRYVAHWVKEGDVIKPEMLRIARDGDDKTLSEVHKMLANTLGLDGYKEVRQSERAFVYVKSQEINTQDNAQQITGVEFSEADLEFRPSDRRAGKDKESDGQREVIDEIGAGEKVDTATAVTKRVVVDFNQTVREAVISAQTRRKKSNEIESVISSTDKRDQPAGAEVVTEKISRQPVDLRPEIKKASQEMSKNVAKLKVITETKVAVGAIPVLLAALSERPSGRLKAVDKSFRRQREKLMRIKRRKAVSDKAEINLFSKTSKDGYTRGKLVKSDKVVFVRPRGDIEKLNLLSRNLLGRDKKRRIRLTEAGVENEIKKRGISLRDYVQVEADSIDAGPKSDWKRKLKSVKRQFGELIYKVGESKDIKVRKSKRKIKSEMIMLRKRGVREMFARGEVVKKQKLMVKDNKSLVVESRMVGHKREKSEGEMRVGARQMKRLEYVVRRLLYRHQKHSREIDRFITPEIKHIKINLKVSRERRRQVMGREYATKYDKRLRSKEAAAGLGLSWAIWLLISKQQVREAPSIREGFSLKSTVQEKAKTEMLHPWLILAIIYYLAMVREQGQRQVLSSQFTVHGNKVKHKKNKRRGRKVNLRDNEFPRAGVIFAALS